MGRSTKYTARTPQRWAELLAQCAEDGLAVTDSAKRLGLHVTTFATWEKKHEAFREAAIGIRHNSERLLLARTARNLERSEERLIRQLAWIRTQRIAEQQRVDQAIAEGKMPSPERVKELIECVKEARREARQRERAAQKQAVRPPVIEIRHVPFDPPTKQ